VAVNDAGNLVLGEQSTGGGATEGATHLCF